MGFTQRQPGGKFTRTEADTFIERLRETESDLEKSIEVPTWRRSAQERVLRKPAAEPLAIELPRRGWTVIEP
jgi:hypothetical protein